MIKVKGTKGSLEKFQAYFEGPPRIEAATIEDDDGGLIVTVEAEHADFIKHVAEKFGCAAEIK